MNDNKPSVWKSLEVGDVVRYRFIEERFGKGTAREEVASVDETTVTLTDGATFSRETGKAIGTQQIVDHDGSYIFSWVPKRILKPQNWSRA